VRVFVIEEKDSNMTDERSADTSKSPLPKSPTNTVGLFPHLAVGRIIIVVCLFDRLSVVDDVSFNKRVSGSE